MDLTTDPNIIDFNDISLESLGVHLMFGDVNSETTRPAITFILKGNMILKNHLTVVVNTVGGETSEGFALIDVMEASSLPIHTVGMGNIMSMGVLILTAGAVGHRTMMKNSSVMAHQFSGWPQGKFHELVSAHKSMEYLRTQMVSHFVRRTKLSEKQVNDVLFSPTDRYLTPRECKKYGLIDHIVDELDELNLDLSLSQPVLVPASARSKRQPAQKS